MFYGWLILVIVLAVIEAITVNLTTIWFVVSGIIAMILSFFTDSITVQFAVFALFGIFLLIVTKPILKKYFHRSKIETNLDRVIGMDGLVTEKITKTTGEVKADGKLWTAYADEEIMPDTVVKIVKRTGVKIKVEKEGE